MTESILDLRGFTHLTILYRSKGSTLYRLLYPQNTKYLQITPETAKLLDDKGQLVQISLDPLIEKIEVYERLFSKSLSVESLDNFLRLDEVRFLLDELLINNHELEQQLETRLYDHLNQPYVRRYHKPLLLPHLLTRHEFVTNYLQTNIGLPEESDNYYNKLREMIEQIEEQIAYVDPDYFLVIQALLQLVDRLYPDQQTIVLKSPYSSCIIRTGADLIPHTYYDFIIKSSTLLFSVPVNNQFVFQSIRIFQELV